MVGVCMLWSSSVAFFEAYNAVLLFYVPAQSDVVNVHTSSSAIATVNVVLCDCHVTLVMLYTLVVYIMITP